MRPRILFDLDDTILNTSEAVIRTYRPNLTSEEVQKLVLQNKTWNFTSVIPEYDAAIYDDPTFQSHLKIDSSFFVLEATLFRYFDVVLGTGGTDTYNEFKRKMFPGYKVHFFPCTPFPHKKDFPCDIQIDDRSSCLSSKAPLKILKKNGKDTDYNQDVPENGYIINWLSELEPILSFYLRHPEFYQ